MVPQHSPRFDYQELRIQLSEVQNDTNLFRIIVNAPFQNPLPPALIFLGIVVLLLVDPKTKTINRVALSETQMARLTTDVSAVPFQAIKIPLDHYENVIAHAVATGEPSDTTDWRFLFEPAMTAEQARLNQANAGIAYSAVFPFEARSGGALIFSYYQYQSEIGIKQMEFMQQYTALVDERLQD